MPCTSWRVVAFAHSSSMLWRLPVSGQGGQLGSPKEFARLYPSTLPILFFLSSSPTTPLQGAAAFGRPREDFPGSHKENIAGQGEAGVSFSVCGIC